MSRYTLSSFVAYEASSAGKNKHNLQLDAALKFGKINHTRVNAKDVDNIGRDLENNVDFSRSMSQGHDEKSIVAE